MSRIRKTANIAEILHNVNRKLLHSTCSQDVRRGFASVLESILMDAGLYAGFAYLTGEDLANVHGSTSGRVQLPGVRYSTGSGREITPGEYFDDLLGCRERGHKTPFVQSFPDESRRFYHVHRAIWKDYDEIERTRGSR